MIIAMTVLFFILGFSLLWALAVPSEELSSSAAVHDRLSLRASPVRCSAARYGANVRVRSARSALAKVSQNPAPVTFQMREIDEEPNWWTDLPYRILSGKLVPWDRIGFYS